jgi:hypothetical protein
MRSFLLLAVVGLAAQLVDGSLGMAYGVTSHSLLLAVGIAPALASAAVRVAEVGTTAASGASHRRFGNIDWDKVRPLAIPRAIGAFLGAVVISRFITAEAAEAAEAAEPLVDLPLPPRRLHPGPLLVPAAPDARRLEADLGQVPLRWASWPAFLTR